MEDGPKMDWIFIIFCPKIHPAVSHPPMLAVAEVRFPLSAMSSKLGNFSRGCAYLVMLAMTLAASLAISNQS